MSFSGLARLCLVLISGYVFNISTTPPLGSMKMPPRPTTKSPWPVWREYLIVRVLSNTMTPLQRATYIIVTVLESIYILSSLRQASHESPIARPGASVGLSRFTGVTLLPNAPRLHLSTLPIIGLIIGIGGCLLRIACYRALGGGFTYEIPNNATGKAAPKLVTTGPYSVVRHPSYLGAWLTAIGLPAYHLSNGSWIVESGFLDWQIWGMLDIGKTLVCGWIATRLAVVVLLSMRAGYEDMLLRKQFGQEWDIWSGRVRYRVIPGLY
ncbi:hypothetical protein PM082_016587 [Marasmius tenuissimus]|nr:hypothetical protein PM082_016587 [Marasmius tenuissimus]